MTDETDAAREAATPDLPVQEQATIDDLLTPEDEAEAAAILAAASGEGGTSEREPSGSGRPPDPADVAALNMLHAAIAASPGGRDSVAACGLAVVEAPSPAWCAPLMDAWNAVLGAPEAADVTGVLRRAPVRALDALRARVWLRVCADGGKESGDRSVTGTSAAEGIAVALREARGVVGVSHAPDRLLPRDLVRAADHRVAVPAMSAHLLAAVAGMVAAGTATSEVTDEEAARVSPADLRLAIRRGQTADDYLRRVLALSAPARPERPVMTLDDLHGADEAVAWGEALATDLENYARGLLPWSAVDRGAVLAGPPGTGKTTFARALAGTTGLPLIATSFAAWDTASGKGYLSDLLKAMREDFDRARREAPCILFIDEIDSIPSRGSSDRHDDYWRAVVNCLLECLDGVGSREGVVVIAATNHPENLDPALVRSGRLDRTIRIPLPDADALAGILRLHLGEDDLPEADLGEVATAAHDAGATGADCERWVRGARRRAREEARPVEADDLLAEIRGPEPDPLTPELERRTAFHEAGHALAAVLRLPGWLRSVDLVRRGSSGGRTRSAAELDDAPTPSAVRAQLVYLLGGRAAEEVVLGEPSAGAGGTQNSDLAVASAIALNATASFGLGGRLLWMGEPNDYGRTLALQPAALDAAEAMLRDAYAEAVDLLRENAVALRAVAASLLRRRSLTGADVETIVARIRAQASAGTGAPAREASAWR